MVQCDSPVVQALVDRARSPMNTGDDIRGELAEALQISGLSNRDRGNLLFAEVVASQGRVPDEQAAVAVEQSISLLKETGDDEVLSSALGVSAALHATIGDMERCLDRCLDLATLMGSDSALDRFPIRSVVNFGVALLALGAYELAGDLFATGVRRSFEVEEFTPILVSSLNLALSISREQLVNPHGHEAEGRHRDLLHLVERAVDRMDTIAAPSAANTDFVVAVRSHLAQLRGDLDEAARVWGDIDALAGDPTDSFAQYFCLLEAPICLHRGQVDRALALVNRSLNEITGRDLVPLRRVEALRLRSTIHERKGDAAAALADSREATELALLETSRLPDVLIGQINQRVVLEQSQRHLMDQTTELTEQALVDELSQVGNRRAYEQAIDDLRVGPQVAVGVVVCDIDGFKEINDQYGHGVGDAVVAEVGRMLGAASRSNDQVFRYGGDEFVLLVPVLSTSDALRVAERIHAAFLQTDWTGLGVPEPVTCSIGVWAGSSELIEETVAEADTQLYEAKRAGRNRIRPVVAPG